MNAVRLGVLGRRKLSSKNRWKKMKEARPRPPPHAHPQPGPHSSSRRSSAVGTASLRLEGRVPCTSCEVRRNPGRKSPDQTMTHGKIKWFNSLLKIIRDLHKLFSYIHIHIRTYNWLLILLL